MNGLVCVEDRTWMECAPCKRQKLIFPYLFKNHTAGNTGNNVYSGDRYCGNDRYSRLKPADNAILFTVSGITTIADKKSEILIKKDRLLIYIQKV